MTPCRLLRFLALAVIFSDASVTFVSAASELPCHCEFSGDNDTPGCVVFGQLGDGDLIAWNVAPQACLDYYNIKDEAVDPDTLSGMFPNPDGTGGSPSAFVNYLRFDDGSVASGIKAGFPQFWVESTTQPGKMVLQDEIQVGSLTYVCSSEIGGSEGSCWTAVRTYFSSEPGDTEMANVGKDLYAQQAVSREKEQSLVRIRICSDGPPEGGECGDLAGQVQQVKEEKPDKFCSAFGLGPAAYEYSKCSEDSGSQGSENSNTDNPDSAAFSLSVGLFIATASVALFGMIC